MTNFRHLIFTKCKNKKKKITGPTGPQGDTGPQGFNGPQGLQGDNGLQGDVGPQGIQGLQGDVGPQGIQGLQGDVGPQGIQGLQGDVGPTGLQGNVGPQGIQGLQGDVGPQGIQGLQGDTGPQGIQGLQGNVGPQGLQGDVGPQGIQGLQGDTGPQGQASVDENNNILLGNWSGTGSTGLANLAIGNNIGDKTLTQNGNWNIAIGLNSGVEQNNDQNIAIGSASGNSQSGSSIAIGRRSGQNQDNNTVALGLFSLDQIGSVNSQPNGSIILNTQGINEFNDTSPLNQNSTYICPIRNDTDFDSYNQQITPPKNLMYNTNTKEVNTNGSVWSSKIILYNTNDNTKYIELTCDNNGQILVNGSNYNNDTFQT